MPGACSGGHALLLGLGSLPFPLGSLHFSRYDAVTIEGKLQWQNTLNALNRCAQSAQLAMRHAVWLAMLLRQ